MNAFFRQLIGIVLGFLAALPVAHALPREDAVPGGIALIRLGQAAHAPHVWFQEKRVAVLRNRQGWVALVGLPLSLEPGVHELRIAHPGRAEETRPLHVAAKRYALQRFTVPDQRKVEPLPEDELRIAREQKRIGEIKAAFRDEPAPDLAFRQPPQGDAFEQQVRTEGHRTLWARR